MTQSSRRTVLGQIGGVAGSGLLLPALGAPALAQTPDPQLAEIAPALGDGGMLRPGDAGHAKVRYYNARFDCVRGTTYLRPQTAEAVRQIVEWANKHNRTFAIRGGGHSFEGKSSHPDLVVDMSRMTKLDLKADGTLEVGAGVVLGDIYKKLSPANRILPAGTCPTVGVVGHTLGGGIGDFLPIFGYAAQSLKALTLVTLAGSHVEISDAGIKVVAGPPLPEGIAAAELMTILRGGGQGTLGIVTDMTFDTHDVKGARIASFALEGADGLSTERAVALLAAWQTWRQRLEPAMHELVSSKVNYGKTGDRSGIEIQGLIVVPKGSPFDFEAVRRALDPLFKLSEWKARKVSKPLDAAGAIKSFLDDNDTTNNPRRRMLYGSSSVLPKPLNEAALTHLVRNVPSGLYVSLYTAGGRTTKAPATSLHPAQFLVEWVGWSNGLAPELYPKVRAVNLETMRKAGLEPHAFPNYCDPGPREYYPNKARIAELRTKFDPKSLSTSSLLAETKGADTTCR